MLGLAPALGQLRFPLEDTEGDGNITESFQGSSLAKFDYWDKGRFVFCR